ncbi:hypothetical protein ACIGZJ_17695 [Kitasatospora sp. NPDC052868]|uniref:hypothetical protein n=1 Tax=Kitasatospora sp. NPDC052868 TaxID=3364060 RepID=UPI0037CA471E
MPQLVRRLRVLMTVLGAAQAVSGLFLVTNSLSVAIAVWGNDGVSQHCCRTQGEAHAGLVTFAGVLLLAVAAWGIVTALQFPTRRPNVRSSARAYGWTALALALPLLPVLRFFGLLLLVVAVVALVWPNEQEVRAWFDAERTTP